MIVLFLSIVGVLLGVVASDTAISDPESLILLGVALIGVAIYFKHGSGRRG